MGLSALLGAEAEDAGFSRSDAVRKVPIAFLSPSQLQPRRHFDEEELARLAESMRDRKGVPLHA